MTTRSQSFRIDEIIETNIHTSDPSATSDNQLKESSMSVKVHCVFAISKNKTIAINFSNEFDIELDCEAKVLEIYRRVRGRDQERFAIGSMLTLYGENGAGKTKILLDIANLFSNNKGHKSAGSLFIEDGEIRLRRGLALQGYTIKGLQDYAEVRTCPKCPSVFYTTSPYEYSRRRSLAANGYSLDVSPTFGQRNTFDGLALLRAKEWINKEFVNRSRIKFRLKLLSIEEGAVSFSAHAKRIRENRALPAYFRATLIRVSKTLDPAENIYLRSLLTLFFATTNDAGAILPDEILSHLDYSNSSLDDNKFYQSLLAFLQRVCREEIGDDTTTKIVDLIQVITRKPIDIIFSPNELEKYIAEELDGPTEILEICANLGIISFSITGLSSGETAFAVLFSALHGALVRIEKNIESSESPIFVLIDEGEMFMHPKWQREYLKLLLDFIQRFPKIEPNIHLLLTTHSLIVAADSPPCSLFNVETGKAMNAFGLGPKTVLEHIYGVAVFHGMLSETSLMQIEEFLKLPQRSDYAMIKHTISLLADQQVAEFLSDQVDDALRRTAQ